MKALIITRPRGVRKNKAEICVREFDDHEAALRAYPQIRTYENYVFNDRDEIRYWSPAAIRFYNSRNLMDKFKTIYLTD